MASFGKMRAALDAPKQAISVAVVALLVAFAALLLAMGGRK